MLTPITCFLVDDDADDQEIFQLALQDINKDIQCITANNGIEALDKLTREKNFLPDFIFIDLNMPRMNGKECLVEIKKMQGRNHIPVIIYSTSSDQRDMTEAKKLGAVHFITKPSGIGILTQLLTEVFETQQKPVLSSH